MAAGRAGVPYDLDRVKHLDFRPVRLRRHGNRSAGGGSIRAKTQGEEVFLRMDLGQGDAEATAWGCDLTEEYVRFNADYVT